MPSRVHARRGVIAVACVCLAAVLTTAGCSKAAPVSTYDRLLEDLKTIKVVNTHEHQRWFPQYEGQNLNFYTLLAHSYLAADLVSAGAPPLKTDAVEEDLDALWTTYGPYLDACRATSYYGQFAAGFRLLYGFSDPAFTAASVRELSARIAANYLTPEVRRAWYALACEKAGFEVMFVDTYWDAYDTEPDSPFFALVLNVGPLVGSASLRDRLTSAKAPAQTNIYKTAADAKEPIRTLDDYLDAAGGLLRDFAARGAVCLKNSQAYSRVLDYEDIPYTRAKALFSRSLEGLTDAERKELQDFMFHWVADRAAELDLPIQVHTGYLAGNGNMQENGRPMRLNGFLLKHRKTRFSLFHGGYPWVGEFAALGKSLPNVALDLVWLPQISREAAIRGLDEILDTVPANKLFWGGDCEFIEESAGSLAFGRDVVARVLAARVERGLLAEEAARAIGRMIFRDNAIAFFKLREKRPGLS
jgi:hypothetical protein